MIKIYVQIIFCLIHFLRMKTKKIILVKPQNWALFIAHWYIQRNNQSYGRSLFFRRHSGSGEFFNKKIIESKKKAASVLTDSNNNHSKYVSVTLPSSKKGKRHGTKHYWYI